MTFKNFHSLAKKPEMRSRVGYSCFGSYDELLYLLGKEADFFKWEADNLKSRVAKDAARNGLKFTLEQIQFVNMCRNNEL